MKKQRKHYSTLLLQQAKKNVPGFGPARHYGILSNRNKEKLRKLQMSAGITPVKPPKQSWKEIARRNLGYDPDLCPCCKTGKMIRLMSFDANPPPEMICHAEKKFKVSIKK